VMIVVAPWFLLRFYHLTIPHAGNGGTQRTQQDLYLQQRDVTTSHAKQLYADVILTVVKMLGIYLAVDTN